MNTITANDPAKPRDAAIRPLSPSEIQIVAGGAISVSPSQIQGIAKLFTSVGGGTATSGIAPRTGSLAPY